MTLLRTALFVTVAFASLHCGLGTLDVAAGDGRADSARALKVTEPGQGESTPTCRAATHTTDTVEPHGETTTTTTTTTCEQRDGGGSDGGDPACNPTIPVHVHFNPFTVSATPHSGSITSTPSFSLSPTGGSLHLSFSGDPGWAEHRAKVDDGAILEDIIHRFGGIEWRSPVVENLRFDVRNLTPSADFRLPPLESLPDECVDTPEGRECFTDVVGTSFRYQAELKFQVLQSGGGTHPFETSIFAGGFHNVTVPIGGSIRGGIGEDGQFNVFQSVVDSSQFGAIIEVGIRTRVGRVFVGADVCAEYNLTTEQADLRASIGFVLR